MKRKSLKMLMKNEDGAVVVIVALMMTVLMGFAALAIDVGFMYNQRRSLQNAADAGALAGVLELELTGDYKSAAIAAVQKNINIPVGNIDVNTVGTHAVKVNVKQEAVRIFSVFITSGTSNVGATATAEKIQWAGDALPFLNQTSYVGISGIWEKLGENPGSFEGIDKDERPPVYVSGDKNDLSQGVYYNINFEDGIIVNNGAMAEVKQEVEAIYTQKLAANETVYILSLRDTVIEADWVILTDGTGKKVTELNTGDVIAKSQLVLIKCKFLEFGNQWDTGKFEVVQVFDIGAGVYPTNYIEPTGRAARLIN